ncbi:sulfatase [Actinomadura sp. 6N118]|uniref:sulfatase n=1 Tax=Actinomadura sp. 6N118 TaxID=3375151 RepID=UPI003794A0F9
MLRARPRRLAGALIAVAMVLAGCGGMGGGGKRAKAPATADAEAARNKPNLVYVLTDDLDWGLLQYMPNVKRLQQRGMTFSNYFVADTLCCPSRATILTGKFPHNTGVQSNDPPTGGFTVFQQRGNEQNTFAMSLQRAGYRTALMGKYMNGYEPTKQQGSTRTYVPPGWTEWQVTGLGYGMYNYNLNSNGVLRYYGRAPRDYLNRVLSDKGVDFINRSVDTRRPFMLQMSTFSPHAPATPAPQDAKSFAKLKAPRTPGFNEPDISDKPGWLRTYPQLSPKQVQAIDRAYRERVRAVQSVDRMIGKLQATLNAKGVGNNTYFVFNSDNGYHMGQHRLDEGKLTAYDTDIKVPLIVSGPGVRAGSTEQRFTQNTDISPTFQELAGVKPSQNTDGRSLLPLLQGKSVRDWRISAFIEHLGPKFQKNDPDLPLKYGGNPPTYAAVRTASELYVEYQNGDREYYDLTRDPYQLGNLYAQMPAARRTELQGVLGAYRTCAGAACRKIR